ncbi:S1 RNA-binding domain-containing protein [Crateriforma conspicua]|uniref:30S ribosomal protein S1 n=1 Tax=Crateriforma conspicua TaxID=2527996 RepID=A0A5C6FTB3_9PLAN|nr:S1 RNA-binding domain-containing protein [Crateriforma conspicua]TWU66119.1 30S ribosomal protein S1 [Crateriforma conspicua]
MTNGEQTPETGSPASDSASPQDPANATAPTPRPDDAVPIPENASEKASENTVTPDPAPVDTPSAAPAAESDSSAGDDAKPVARGSGPLAARGLGLAKPASPVATTDAGAAPSNKPAKKKKSGGKKAPRPRLAGERGSTDNAPKVVPSGVTTPAAAKAPPKQGKVAVPSLRQPLSDDLQAELDMQLADSDIDSILGGGAGMPDRKEPLAEGSRLQGRVLKIHDDSVFIGMGGPDEGVVPFEQFEQEPEIGSSVEVMVRGFNGEDGLYVLTLPGQAVDVSDWADMEEGSVVEATITGHNAGGLECKVGGVRGFIPISQVTEYRVEDLSEFVDQRMICLVTEANERRGNLVLSRRAILEREREEKRKEQLEKLEVGDELKGTVRSIKDFGAFVDLGGLDGLIHISKLSWDRVKHPSEVLEEGQEVQVKLEKVDKATGKISLSYRDLLENPWDTAEATFAAGTVHKGTVTRIANFGCFVRLAAGIEGLVHISELAHHRVSKISAFVSEGDEVEVKVLSFDRDTQKIALSIKAAQTSAADTAKTKPTEEEIGPPREMAVKSRHDGPLKGGNNRDTGGERFGLRW